MPNHELEFVGSLIEESRGAQRFFKIFGCVLILLGCSSIAWTLHKGDKLYTVTGAVISLFGAIPICLFYAARANEIYFAFWKKSWQDAQASNDLVALKKLDDELTVFRKGPFSKPFWLIGQKT
jgi:uncharacterized membrane protein HdeD (DUF308 family)